MKHRGALVIVGLTLLLVLSLDVAADVVCQEEATCKTPTPTANMTIPTRTPDPTNTPDPPTPTMVETVPTRTPVPDTPTPETVLGTPWTSVPETPTPTDEPLWTPVWTPHYTPEKTRKPTPTKDRGNYQPHTPTPVFYLPDTGDPWEEIVEVVVYDYATAWALGIGWLMGVVTMVVAHKLYGGRKR